MSTAERVSEASSVKQVNGASEQMRWRSTLRVDFKRFLLKVRRSLGGECLLQSVRNTNDVVI